MVFQIFIFKEMCYLYSRGIGKDMPFKKTEVRVKLLKNITKAIKEAREAGVGNPLELLKRTLDSRIKYKTWKTHKGK